MPAIRHVHILLNENKILLHKSEIHNIGFRTKIVLNVLKCVLLFNVFIILLLNFTKKYYIFLNVFLKNLILYYIQYTYHDKLYLYISLYGFL